MNIGKIACPGCITTNDSHKSTVALKKKKKVRQKKETFAPTGDDY